MIRSVTVCLFSLVVLVTGCVREFICTAPADCQIFGENNVCEQRNGDDNSHCYLKFVPRTCEKTGMPIASAHSVDYSLFGTYVSAVDGNTILIGAPLQQYGGTSPGDAEIWTSEARGWQGVSLFYPNPPAGMNQGVGNGVYINKTRAIVNSDKRTYLFNKIDNTWSKEPMPLLPASAAGGFQRGVVITDNLVFASYDTQGSDRYVVYAYENDSRPCLTISGLNGWSGSSLAHNDNYLAIGANNGAGVSGPVHVLDISGGCAASSTPMPLPGGSGSAVAFLGQDMLLVAAPDQAAQPFFAYQLQGSGWVLSAAQPAAASSRFKWGTAISADGDLVAVGGIDGTKVGSVLVYQRHAGSWTTPFVVDVPVPASGYDFRSGNFGKSVAVSKNLLVVGAPDATVPMVTTGPAGAVMVYNCP